MKSQINKKKIGFYNMETGEPYSTTLDSYEHERKVQKLKNSYILGKKGCEFTQTVMETTKDVSQILNEWT